MPHIHRDLVHFSPDSEPEITSTTPVKTSSCRLWGRHRAVEGPHSDALRLQQGTTQSFTDLQNEYRTPIRKRHRESSGSVVKGVSRGAKMNILGSDPALRSNGTIWFGTV